MTNNVYYSTKINPFLIKLKDIFQEEFSSCKTIAIKLHFGEPGNSTTFKPRDIKPITDLLNELNIGYFLYDSSVVYKSPRDNPETHLKIAKAKGWGKLGQLKTNDDCVPFKTDNLTYEVCKELMDADGVLVISHFKGHVCSGFGGAIKNLGMGALSAKTKGAIHDGGKPYLDGDCTECGTCENSCAIKGITVKSGGPIFNLCFGCSNCIYVCPEEILKPQVNYYDLLLAEGASIAAANFKKAYYISYLTKITEQCDCMNQTTPIIAKDSGFIASPDGVAIDQAGHDIICQQAGKDVFLEHNKKSGTEQVKFAEKFGMGKSAYNLITL